MDISTYLSWIQDYYFEVVIIGCIGFLVLYAVYSKLSGKKGTWSKVTPQIIHNEEEDKEENDVYNNEETTKKRRRRGGGGESKGEVECRRVMQKLFDKPFYKIRPQFLNNPVTFGTNNLELDCFNEELKLAVEYDGAQHYKFIPHFHKTHDGFMNQRYRDYMKEQMCKENKIRLIRVPYTVKIENIESFIVNKLEEMLI
jgi:hypothetical protein